MRSLKLFVLSSGYGPFLLESLSVLEIRLFLSMLQITSHKAMGYIQQALWQVTLSSDLC